MHTTLKKKKNNTNQQLHLFQSLAQFLNLVLSSLESGLQLENKQQKKKVKIQSQFPEVLYISLVIAKQLTSLSSFCRLHSRLPMAEFAWRTMMTHLSVGGLFAVLLLCDKFFIEVHRLLELGGCRGGLYCCLKTKTKNTALNFLPCVYMKQNTTTGL